MMKRLKTYLESQVVEVNEAEKDEPLFKFDYTNRLDNLSISYEDNMKILRLVRTKTKELLEFNDDREKDIEELKDKLEKEKSER